MTEKHLEIRMVEGHEQLVGKDPREMSPVELNELGHHQAPLRKIIREHCISCCGGAQIEVRNCSIVSCQFWPYRMNKNPFSTRKASPESLAALKAFRDSRGSDD